MASVKIIHFSDILCIWAHVGQGVLARLMQDQGRAVEAEVHFCSVFPDAHGKIGKAWAQRGGFQGYGDHVAQVAARFPGTALHPDTWHRTQPRSSASPHLFVKAVELLAATRGEGPETAFADRLAIRAARALRAAFFQQGQDIATWGVQRQVAAGIGLDFDDILQRIETGEAIARLAADYDLAQAMGVQGSPTYILNEGRQKLFGDISYRILAANVAELQSAAQGEAASACA